jgi:hypothetical protein
LVPLCNHRAVRVQRSFCFVDLSGFTALTEASGDERAVSVLTGLAAPAEGSLRDPVCGIPLVAEIAVEVRRDSSGATVLLCSDSCLETWLGRDQAAALRG